MSRRRDRLSPGSPAYMAESASRSPLATLDVAPSFAHFPGKVYGIPWNQSAEERLRVLARDPAEVNYSSVRASPPVLVGERGPEIIEFQSKLARAMWGGKRIEVKL